MNDPKKPKRLAPPTAWKPGQSGNPLGRTAPEMSMAKAVARQIADSTDNGKDVVRRLLEMAGLGDNPVMASNAAERRIAVAACEILLERGAGKSPQEVQISLGNPREADNRKLRRLTVEDLEVLARLDLEDPDSAAAELELGADRPAEVDVAAGAMRLLDAAAPLDIIDAEATEERDS